MADEQTSTVDSATTQATEQNQPPQQTQQQPPQQTHTDRGPGPGQQLLDAINALPERLVHAIQEATPKQTVTKPPASTKDTDTKTEATKSTKDTSENPGPGGVKLTRQQRFVKWYGGQ